VRLNVKTATVDQLVAAYAEAAKAHGKAVVVGDHKTANSTMDQLGWPQRWTSLRRRVPISSPRSSFSSQEPLDSCDSAGGVSPDSRLLAFRGCMGRLVLLHPGRVHARGASHGIPSLAGRVDPSGVPASAASEELVQGRIASRLVQLPHFGPAEAGRDVVLDQTARLYEPASVDTVAVVACRRQESWYG
jgi:hypothetical protein